MLAPIRDVLLDIEGTTSSIHFVHKVLFPYAREHLAEFIQKHHHETAVEQALSLTKVSLSSDGRPSESIQDVIQGLLRYIDEDRKDTGLKALQGKLWRVGYEQQDYQGHVYPDVLPTLQQWQSSQLRVSIYSSGSVEAQQLIFGYSTSGDLRSYLHRYFDTKVGHKREAASYRGIAAALERQPTEILFLSDVHEELAAAAEVGFHTLQVVRESPPEDSHESATALLPGRLPAPKVTTLSQAATLLEDWNQQF